MFAHTRMSTQQLTTEQQMELNLTGPRPALYIALLPGFHQPHKSPENWEKSVQSVAKLFAGKGDVEAVSFKRRKKGGTACFVQFSSLDDDIINALRDAGHFKIQGPLRVRRDWDYSRGQPRRTWDYHVSVSRFAFLTADERRARRRARAEAAAVPKFIFSTTAQPDDDDPM